MLLLFCIACGAALATQGCSPAAASAIAPRAAPIVAAGVVGAAVVAVVVLADLEYSAAQTEVRTPSSPDEGFEDAPEYVDTSGEIQRARQKRAMTTPAPAEPSLDDVELRRDTSELLRTPAPSPLKTGDLEPTTSPGALQAAVGAVDLAPCGAPLGREGTPPGYGRARVTFEPNGRVSRVVIEGPANMAREAVMCMGDKLAATRAQPFRGKAVVVGRTWYMR